MGNKLYMVKEFWDFIGSYRVITYTILQKRKVLLKLEVINILMQDIKLTKLRKQILFLCFSQEIKIKILKTSIGKS